MGRSSVVEELAIRECDWAVESPSFAVIDAIARYEDTEPDQMDDDLPLLEDAVDTDALDTLFRNTRPLAVTFTYAGYHIHLTEELVTVSPATSTNT